MIDPIVFFRLCDLTHKRKVIKIRLTEGVEGRSISLNVSGGAAFSSSCVYCAPHRDFEVLSKIMPDRVIVELVDKSVVESELGIAILSVGVDIPEPPEVDAIKILALDLFQGHDKAMRSAEMELRDFRRSLARRSIACTMTVACSVNSASYQAHRKTHFQSFDKIVFPVGIDELRSYNLLISMEGADESNKAIWPNFRQFRTVRRQA